MHANGARHQARPNLRRYGGSLARGRIRVLSFGGGVAGFRDEHGQARVRLLFADAKINRAQFGSHCGNGVVVDRPSTDLAQSDIHVHKVRFDGTGKKGMVKMSFNTESGRFGYLDEGKADAA